MVRKIVLKKAQAQVITAILIILLVLAAVVVVWRVVQRTIGTGADEIDSKSRCIGLIMEIIDVNTSMGLITMRSLSDIDSYRVYVDGVEFGDVAGSRLNALEVATINARIDGGGLPVESVSRGQEIEIFGKVGETWCSAVKERVK